MSVSVEHAQLLINSPNTISEAIVGITEADFQVDGQNLGTARNVAIDSAPFDIDGSVIVLSWTQDTLTIDVNAASITIAVQAIEGRRGTPVISGAPTIAGSNILFQLSSGSWTLPVDRGLPTILGNDVVLEKNQIYDAAALSFVGSSIPLSEGAVVASAAPSIAGQDITLSWGQGTIGVLHAQPTIAGQEIGLNKSWSLAVDYTSFDIDGQNIVFDWVVPSTVVVEPAALSFSPANVNFARDIDVTSTALSPSGQTLARGDGIIVISAGVELNPQNVDFIYDYPFGYAFEAAEFGFVGNDVVLFVGDGMPTRFRSSIIKDQIEIGFSAPPTFRRHFSERIRG